MDEMSPDKKQTPGRGAGLRHALGCPARDYWKDEARDFTPWLAQPDNMKLLAETIDMEFEPPFRTEEPVGPFRADMVAQEGDGVVIIENQLSPIDHRRS